MIPATEYIATLRLAEETRDIDGCVVECGVWKGGMAAGLVAVLGAHRQYLLFDSFQGLPECKEIDGDAAISWQTDKNSPSYFDNCYAPPMFVEQAMRLTGSKDYHIIKGWFNQTLDKFPWSQPISFLHLDADWYDSTITCLNFLFDRVAPGGVIVLDDYHTWDGCSRALHYFLSSRSAAERVSSLGKVCYLRKAALL